MQLELFNPVSAQNDASSEAFFLDHQYTVYAVGLPAGDYISFDIVALGKPGVTDPSKIGCGLQLPFRPDIAGLAPMLGIEELTCCNAPVQIRAGQAAVIIDKPMGAYIRAVYHGTGGSTPYVFANKSDVQGVTDSMRGCCAPEPEKELLTIRGCDGSVLVQGLLEVI
jgi:hypothetical protein